MRYMASLHNKEMYHRTTMVPTYKRKYTDYLEIAVRKFVRCLFTEENGLSSSKFVNYKEIVDFLSVCQGVNLNVNTVSQLKRRPLLHGKLQDNDEVRLFADYIEDSGKFPNFDKDLFINGSMEVKGVAKLQ